MLHTLRRVQGLKNWQGLNIALFLGAAVVRTILFRCWWPIHRRPCCKSKFWSSQNRSVSWAKMGSASRHGANTRVQEPSGAIWMNGNHQKWEAWRGKNALTIECPHFFSKPVFQSEKSRQHNACSPFALVQQTRSKRRIKKPKPGKRKTIWIIVSSLGTTAGIFVLPLRMWIEHRNQ